jgi:hypothetical protein
VSSVGVGHLFSVPNTLDGTRLIPEMKGRSLEDMDVLFGSICVEDREADMEKGVFILHDTVRSPSR